MNANKALAIAASIGLAFAAQSSFAATGDHLVTPHQINQIRAGQSASEVSQALGSPENVTSWMNGQHSMVYELSRSSGDQELVYVDFGKDNKVTNVQVEER